MKTLYYTVGGRQLFWEMAILLAHTFRKAGHEDDFLILTDEDRSLPSHPTLQNIKVVNFAKNSNISQSLRSKKHLFQSFHTPQEYPFDICKIRMMISTFFDISEYDRVCYFDADIVILDRIMEKEDLNIQDGIACVFDKKPMRKHIGFPFREIPLLGFSSGFFCLTTNHLSFLQEWLDIYEKLEILDQTAYNIQIVNSRGRVPISCSNEMSFKYPSKGIWHYTKPPANAILKELKKRNLINDSLISDLKTLSYSEDDFRKIKRGEV